MHLILITAIQFFGSVYPNDFILFWLGGTYYSMHFQILQCNLGNRFLVCYVSLTQSEEIYRRRKNRAYHIPQEDSKFLVKILTNLNYHMRCVEMNLKPLEASTSALTKTIRTETFSI